jgi:hypothetical protein
MYISLDNQQSYTEGPLFFQVIEEDLYLEN